MTYDEVKNIISDNTTKLLIIENIVHDVTEFVNRSFATRLFTIYDLVECCLHICCD